jgi:hypothetical protein
MKKFGTPNGAGPGRESENEGFEAVGTPPLVVGGWGLVLFLDLPVPFPVFLVVVVLVLSEGTRLWATLELLPELGLEDPWPPPVFVCEEVVLVVDDVVEVLLLVVVEVDVVLVVVVVVVVGVQEAWTFLTGPVPGGTRLEAGVPAGALTSKVSVWPVRSVTVTLHWSAEADGSAATAMVAIATPAEMARTFSFRRTDTVVRFLPQGWLRRRAATVEPGR